jgi:nucleotide-binding universal stress UspA family protein
MTKTLRILAAIDFSEASLEALHWGAALAQRSGGEVTLLAVTDWPGRTAGSPDADFPSFYDADNGLKVLLEKRLDDLAAATPGLAGKKPVRLVRFGFPETEIVKAAREEDADLIVMGTHGRKGVSRALVGSVAEGVLRNAPCAVTVVRQGIHPAPEKLMAEAGRTDAALVDATSRPG